jgi:predicted hydrocarbon binding protein
VSEENEELPTHFPNKISRIILLALRDVIGDNGSHAVLTTARLAPFIEHDPPADFEPGLTFVEVGRLFEALEGIYGLQGGRQLLRQAGRESFKYWVEGFGGVLTVADVLLRILPISLRVRIGIEVLAEILKRYAYHSITLGEGRDRYFFVMERCGFCWGRKASDPICGFIVGALEEILFWVSRGRHFIIEETTCIACGDPVCTVVIDKVALTQPT